MAKIAQAKIKIMKIENYQTTNPISKVEESGDYYSITQDGLTCGLKKSYGVVPKVGDLITIHTKGGTFGTIRGIDLNGKSIFWKTDEELETSRQNWLKKHEDDKQTKFKENQKILDEKYNNLPKCFQERIDKLRKNNERFRVDFEDYEMFCCEQAVLIADACKTPDEVQAFNKKDWKEQLEQVKGLSDGHSGNTFGCSCSLAFWYLKEKENVVKVSGALSPLVGSKEYGDI